MSHILNELLARATESFERHEEEDALQRLLEAWAESRAEPIIALVQQLSDRLAVGLTPFELDSPWTGEGVQRHPMDLSRVQAGLLRLAREERLHEVRASLDKLRRWWPADPRILPLLLAITRLPVAENILVLDLLCSVFMYVGGPYAVEDLQALRARLAPTLNASRPAPRNRRLPPEPEPSFVIARLDTVIRLGASSASPVLDEEAQARCGALEDAIDVRMATEHSQASTLDALFERVHAVPEDDTARLVLADQLLQRGDPLGEFIVLQHAREPDESRLAGLLAAHQVRWEAPLGPAIERGGTRFERGFPVAVRIMRDDRGRAIPEPGPAWGTVREIGWHKGGLVGRDIIEGWLAFLAHPHLRRVTSLRQVSEGMAVRLATRMLGVRHLELVSRLFLPDVIDALTPLLPLRWLELSVPHESGRRELEVLPVVVQCLGSPRVSTLEHFDVLPASGWWSLKVAPGSDVSVQATLKQVEEGFVRGFATVIRAAARFGARRLHFRLYNRPDDRSMGLLREVTSAYEQVIWE